jgi:hypothetical protein
MRSGLRIYGGRFPRSIHKTQSAVTGVADFIPLDLAGDSHRHQRRYMSLLFSQIRESYSHHSGILSVE